MRPNEKFSRRGRMRHVCKGCARLGKDELAYRQAMRNLGRLLGFDGVIGRRNRNAVGRFLEHSNPRVRNYAREGITHSDRELRRRREERLALKVEEERWEATLLMEPDVEPFGIPHGVARDEMESARRGEEESPSERQRSGPAREVPGARMISGSDDLREQSCKTIYPLPA
jgi:hypothetical protein